MHCWKRYRSLVADCRKMPQRKLCFNPFAYAGTTNVCPFRGNEQLNPPFGAFWRSFSCASHRPFTRETPEGQVEQGRSDPLSAMTAKALSRSTYSHHRAPQAMKPHTGTTETLLLSKFPFSSAGGCPSVVVMQQICQQPSYGSFSEIGTSNSSPRFETFECGVIAQATTGFSLVITSGTSVDITNFVVASSKDFVSAKIALMTAPWLLLIPIEFWGQ